MFNLEQKISDWRAQMLAAGIGSPVPLEELESHLHEEFERGIKSGLDEAQTFELAVQHIGQAGALRKEFNKVKTGYGILRPISLITGWLVAGFALLSAMTGLDFHWNLFNFHEAWDMKTVEDVVQVLAVQTGFWFLAKLSRDRVSNVVSLLICLFLAGYAVDVVFPPEALTQHVHFTGTGHSSDSPTASLVRLAIEHALSRHAASPFWYRGSLTLQFFVPLIFWVWQMRRRINQKRSATPCTNQAWVKLTA